MKSKIARIALAFGAFWLLGASEPLPNRSAHGSVGAVNCASSTCHGSVTAWQGPGILRNEYMTWSRLDRHARAYSTLLSPQSQRIARNLGLQKPAHEAQECLDCHAHAPPQEQRGERFVVADGVSCEGCHGGAADWLARHVEKDATHANNVAHGLYPTADPLAQATLCASCHVGDDSRWVTHRIMGAGHPRLGFEIGTFAALQPAHYRLDADWAERKGDLRPAQVWALGQWVGARNLLTRLADPVKGRDGLFPELSVFDCHACHHPMTDQRWSPRLGVGPGRVRVNDGHLLMLRAIVSVVVPTQAADFQREVRAMHAAVSAGQGDPLPAIRRVLARLDALQPALAAARYDSAELRQITLALIALGGSGEYADYAGAEQAYMLVAQLVDGLAAQGRIELTPVLRQQLDAARATLADEDRYRAARFQAALQQVAASFRTLSMKEG